MSAGYLLLEDGTLFRGRSVGASGAAFGEAVFTTAMTGWLTEGRIKWRETVVEGLDNAPKAFLGLFAGDNIGKMLVRLAT